MSRYNVYTSTKRTPYWFRRATRLDHEPVRNDDKHDKAGDFQSSSKIFLVRFSKDRSVINCPMVAFRSANERHFRGAKGDTNYPNDPKAGVMKPEPMTLLQFKLFAIW